MKSGDRKAVIGAFALLIGATFLVRLPDALAAGPGEPLTLSKAISAALAQNPQIQADRHQLAAADAKATHARSGLLPQLDVAEAYSRTNSPLWAFGTKLNQETITMADFTPERLNDPEPVDNFNTAVTMSWNLFDGGKTWIGWQQAKQNQAATALNLRRSEQQVIAQTAAAYMGLMLAMENRNVVLQSLDTARAHLKVVQDRFRNGLAVKSDVLRAQVRIADLQQQRLHADSQVLVAGAVLKAAMGRDDATSLVPATTFQPIVPTRGELDQWIDQALARRPDLKQVQIQQEIARKEVDRSRAGHWPSLAMQGKYELNSEDFSDSGESYTIGAVVKVNLYSGQRISARTAAAKSMLSRVTAMRQGLALGVRVETQRAFYQARSARQSIEVAETAVDQAEEGLRIVANRYRNGLLTIVDLLDAQVALQQARTRHFKALHDYKVARIELALAAGTINKDFH